MPENCIPYNYFNLPFIDLYYKLNKTKEAEEMATKLESIAESELNYYFKFNANDRNLIDNDIRIDMRIIQQLGMIVKMYGNNDLAQKLDNEFQQFYTLYTNNN